MLETKIGEFEEVVLLLVGILGDNAYAMRIAEEFERQISRSVSIGAVHSSLNRLCKKGFLTSEMKEGTALRGGRRKRVYAITAEGQHALKQSKDLRVGLWQQYPALASDQ